MEEDVKSKLLIVIRAALGLRTNTASFSREDVASIERVAARQSILYIAIVGLEKIGFANLLSDHAKQYIFKAKYDYVQRKEALLEVSKALDSAGISYVPLKGAVLRNLYPQPWMRSSSDVDILVREDTLEEAIRVIETNTSFRLYLRAHHDVQFVNKRVHLELHFSLLSNLEKLDRVLNNVWDYAYRDETCLSFTTEFQVFYITAHSAKHFIREGGVGIRPLLDLWLLRTKTVYDEEMVKELCDQAGILGFYKTCCDLISVWFDGAAYNDITTSFEDIVMSGGVFGSEHLRVVSHGRINKGRKYYSSRIFRSSKDIKEIYPICEKHPILVPYYQVVRWTNLISASKRRAVRKELSDFRNMDSNEAEKYDQLLKSMGL